MAKNKWVTPSFDAEFKKPLQEIPPLSKRRRLIKEQNKQPKFLKTGLSDCKNNSDLSWLESFAPRKKEELVVHKKKIEQVETWLLEKLDSKKSNNGCPLLLLTGPSGCGKTATLKVLAKEHNIDIREWEEANKLVDDWTIDGPELLNQSTVFSNFLLRSSRYVSLFNEKHCEKRILLIEDVPNLFYKDKTVFHNILRKYRANVRTPVVFIISETGSEVSQELKIFPKDFQVELNISVINFNPATNLSISKALFAILTKVSERTKIVIPQKRELDLFAESFKGDVRSAINALQIFRSNATSNHCNSKDSSNKNVLGKNPSLDLFHSIGKILYCKRDQSGSEPKLPKHLTEHRRFPLLENPEEVFQRTAISSETFNLFLHENYLDFVIGLDRMSSCARGFSDSDFLLHEWSIRDYLNPFSSSVAIRSVMFNLNLPGDKRINKLQAFKKPQWFANKKTSNSQQKYVHCEFQNARSSLGKDLEILLIPYLALIRPPSLNSNQMSLVSDMSNFKNQNKRFIHSASSYKNETRVFSVNEKAVDDDCEEFVIEEFE